MHLKNISLKMYAFCCHPWVRRIARLLIFLTVFGFCLEAFAGNGQDFLEGTDSSAWATFDGTGKKYIYLGEGIVALIAYIKTKNISVFFGIIAIAVFIEVLLKMAGQS